MIGLVLATHGPLAEAFVSSGKLIVGNIGNVAHLGLFHGDSIEQFEQKVYKAIEQADEGDGVIVLTDLLGGSPAMSQQRQSADCIKRKSWNAFTVSTFRFFWKL
ncbi:MAG: PTS sugar transporter subunit IIA [Clostridium sp.]